jgi:hypothetical protein
MRHYSLVPKDLLNISQPTENIQWTERTQSSLFLTKYKQFLAAQRT